MFARTRARIEAAAPFPLVGIVRIADALGDRPGVRGTPPGELPVEFRTKMILFKSG
jgi:hypothetical protein